MDAARRLSRSAEGAASGSNGDTGARQGQLPLQATRFSYAQQPQMKDVKRRTPARNAVNSPFGQ
ncbi:hypothetical protein BAUCODRAFT_119434 [Baudoinia panamericana UAMH 10762]|uniref:Uncharacterized protein n=1 Tax=Baudoinia panamericana (strain UAMH 10762) TaxID=717646 RepID=M2N6Y5_BAUPA|nr:uncharacterized protein BAUCODRAFT_119434 [Baudoinia panamericana UAMH 10762]EMC99868.1 hypothetical protein BAUCODRAFT_119434 [Baudoinia panamericana UAMH 10762]